MAQDVALRWSVPVEAYVVCVPSMGTWYRRYHNIPEGASPLQASWQRLLVSHKVVCRKTCTEESGTTNFGTDEQKRYRRLTEMDKQAHLCKVHGQ